MSLLLSNTTPAGMEAKTTSIHSFHKKVFLRRQQESDIEMSFEDFIILVHYVLTNTDLEENDIRLSLVEAIKNSKVVAGWGVLGIPGDPNCTRLDIPLALKEK